MNLDLGERREANQKPGEEDAEREVRIIYIGAIVEGNQDDDLIINGFSWKVFKRKPCVTENYIKEILFVKLYLLNITFDFKN